MSIELVSRVLDMDLPSNLKLPLVAMAEAANSQGSGSELQTVLSRRSSQSERAFRDNLRRLEEAGLMDPPQRRRRDAQVFQLHVHVADVCCCPDGLACRRQPPRKTGSPPPVNQDRQPTAGQRSTADLNKTGSPPPVKNRDAAKPQVTDPESAVGNQDRQPTAGLGKTGSPARQDRQPSVSKTGSRASAPFTSDEPSSPHPLGPPPPSTTRPSDGGGGGEATEADSWPDLPTVRLARHWAQLKGIPFEGARRSLVPKVTEAVEALARDGVTVTLDLLDRAHTAGIRTPGGWWIAATQPANTQLPDCDDCDNRRILTELEDGRRVPPDHPDTYGQAVRDVRCRCITSNEGGTAA